MEGRSTKMEIAGYIWKKDVVDKLIWKHSVTRDEVEEIFANRPRIQFIEKGRVSGEDVYAARGQTKAGRYLTVFFIHKQNNCALIVSARDMDKAERRHYGKK